MFSNDSLKKCIKKRSRKQIEGAPLICFRLFISLSVVPGVIFTNPGVGTVGLTEEQANDKAIDVKTSILDLDNVPRALVNYDATGLIKLVINAQNQQIISVHIVAENAGKVIYAGTLDVKLV